MSSDLWFHPGLSSTEFQILITMQLENARVTGKGYAESTIGPEEVAVSVSLAGTAHALINVDSTRTTFFLGCQDDVACGNQSTTDFKVWKDL